MARLIPLYRLFGNGDHFYTTNKAEADQAAAGVYHFEGDKGVACYVYGSAAPGTQPLWRLFKDDDHFYTCDPNERETAQAGGYHLEGVVGYIYPHPVGAATTFYRLFNGKDHFYTVNANEARQAASGGYHFETAPGCVIAPDITWTMQYDDIRYGPLKIPNSQVDLFASMVVHNKSTTATSHVQSTLTNSREASFAWGINEQFNFGQSLEISATAELSVPGIARGSETVTATVQWGLQVGSHQDWTETKSQSLSSGFSMDVPPGGWSEARGTVNWADDATTDFTLILRASAMTGQGLALNGTQLHDLAIGNEENIAVPKIGTTTILIERKGTFTGSYGGETNVVVEDLSGRPDKTDDAPQYTVSGGTVQLPG